MKLIMLGASKAQLIGIEKANKLGIDIVTCDYYKDSIGHQFASEMNYVSTFDLDGVLQVAKESKADGIMTLGTDQPVLTAAYVANELNLFSYHSVDLARAVTNKIYMKEIFKKHNIDTVDYILYEQGKNDWELEAFDGPVVIKPVDSQGQRGIYYLESASLAKDYYEEVVAFSRESRILVESYYEHDEVTVSGWVEDGNTYLLSMTDRVTFDAKDQLGICLSHEFPTKCLSKYGCIIHEMTLDIVDAFKIKNGPIYFQFLVGDEGVKVNEIACRIGGAHEATFLPLLTGFDICETQIKQTLRMKTDISILNTYNFFECGKHLSVQLFFASPCTIDFMPTEEAVMALNGVIDVGFHVAIGDEINSIHNATARVGFAIVSADSKLKLEERLHDLYKVLVILDKEGNNHIIHRGVDHGHNS